MCSHETRSPTQVFSNRRIALYRYRKRHPEVQEAQSITFYKKLIDQILKNVSTDRPLDAVVRLWTSATRSSLQALQLFPVFTQYGMRPFARTTQP
jgi:hypothetical protein